MTERFDPHRGLILVPATVSGPTGTANLRLAVDTGATTSLIRPVLLVALGYDPAVSPERVQMTTGSGVVFVAKLPVQELSALGQTRRAFGVLSHTLPAGAAVDGLLGLDFFRNGRLEVDFRAGLIRFEP